MNPTKLGILCVFLVICIITLVLYSNTVENLSDHNQNVFDGIYSGGGWGEAGGGSGEGSEPEATRFTTDVLVEFIARHKIRIVIDAGCGACKWTHSLLDELTRHDKQCKYIGVDVSPIAVERCRKNLDRYTENVVVYHGDIADFAFPAADMLMCRDALQHMSYDTIRAVLRNFARSDVHYFVLGSYLDHNDNRDIKTGDYFAINLTLPPFSMSEPLDTFSEKNPPWDHPTKQFVVYTKSQLVRYIETNNFFNIINL